MMDDRKKDLGNCKELDEEKRQEKQKLSK